MSSLATSRKDFFEKLDKQLLTNLGKQQASLVGKFSRRYFSSVSDKELTLTDWEQFYGCVVSVWHFFCSFTGAGHSIRVYNPNYEENGWHSDHTVVEVVCVDSPFLVDSIRMQIIELGVNVHSIHGSVITLDRGGEDIRIGHTLNQKEAVIHFEIDRQAEDVEMENIKTGISRVLELVAMAVGDFTAMTAKLPETSTQLADAIISSELRQEVTDFLVWLGTDNFTFLGYEEYVAGGKKKEQKLTPNPGKMLGIAKPGGETIGDHVSIPADTISLYKIPLKSRVHRPTYLDCISIKLYNEAGETAGLARFIGLFTAEAYSQRPNEIPWVRKKVEEIFLRSGLDSETHLGRELLRHIEIYPREELFFSSVERLYETLLGILSIQERRVVRVFAWPDEGGFFVSCVVYVPRDLYDTDLRIQIQTLLANTFDALEIEFTTFFSESVLARTYYVMRIQPGSKVEFDADTLEQRVASLTRTWEEDLMQAILAANGEAEGSRLWKLFEQAFPESYKSDYSPQIAVLDIRHIQELEAGNGLAMSLYRAVEDEQVILRFKLFLQGAQLVLSDVIPILENMGARVIAENPYQVVPADSREIWIHDFELKFDSATAIEVHEVKDIFQEAFGNVWQGHAENDNFNRLVLASHLNSRQVAIFRAYARYMRQIRFGFGQRYIADVVARFSDISSKLYQLFEVRFNPTLDPKEVRETSVQLRTEVMQSLDLVENLADDRIIRRFLELIEATTRTNYFQLNEAGQHKDWISFKFNPDRITNMPLPKPKFEIFVYSPRVEGVHLRGGKVARGGLRWSDRSEDYRTEILGLVKAQQVKNSVIVPVGAKGGFIPKQTPFNATREQVLEEGIACYRIFIHGLLDLTDNLVGGDVVHPADTVRYDPDDAYLVVAADKGTASFSDIANEISAEYGFWLGDAFASGGSVGYDHKKMGITARGAWKSVQQHFRDLLIDVQTSDITVVGIGDMAGDVFGNGMLMSEHIKLVAAFNHKHIFIDPDPDPKVSFAERKRLFELPRSNWTDYNTSLISEDGGVFSRDAKSIAITARMKALFQIESDSMTPNELLAAIMKAPVDLLWSGGIGTFVKASHESDEDVGDRANDAIRVNGSQLQCKVVGEGGNLGMTQLGRVEYSLKGGACFTDFIDNAGGVNCSDVEVNIKILLNEIVKAGDMTEKQRNVFLETMTDEVAAKVLQNNDEQARIINMATAEAPRRMDEYVRLMVSLESEGKLNRELEFLPNDETVLERKVKGLTLTAPEISVITSYSKNVLKEELALSNIAEDPYVFKEIFQAFPQILVNKYPQAIESHRLKKELVATEICNSMINRMGMNFIYRMRNSTGSDTATATKAYIFGRDVFQMDTMWSEIEGLDLKIDPMLQKELLAAVVRLVRRSARWYVRNRRKGMKLGEEIPLFSGGVQQITAMLSELLVGEGLRHWQGLCEEYLAAGVPDHLARMVAAAPYMYLLLGLIEAARSTNTPVDKVARIYFNLGERMDLHWYSNQLHNLDVTSQWQALAREAFQDDLDSQRRSLTVGVLKQAESGDTVDESIDRWIKSHALLIDRWNRMLVDMRATTTRGYPLFSVATRELLDLAQAGS